MHIALTPFRNIQQYRNAECFNPLKSLKTTTISQIVKYIIYIGPMYDGPHHSVVKAILPLKAL